MNVKESKTILGKKKRLTNDTVKNISFIFWKLRDLIISAWNKIYNLQSEAFTSLHCKGQKELEKTKETEQ